MIENVRGLLDAVFADYRLQIERQLQKMGYVPHWHLFNSSEFGVPQLRPRVVFVAIAKKYAGEFSWPAERTAAPTVGEKLYKLIASQGWKGAKAWRERANEIAPTIVGGSLKHGGPDLGPTRAKKAWATLCVDAHGLADEPPGPEFVGMPRLTVQMIALLQGFPPEWKFSGGKTAAYRQVGNAFPPPVAAAVARRIRQCLTVRQLVQVGAS
jgi:DNA (cytosine-5)-methyltransferase 1